MRADRIADRFAHRQAAVPCVRAFDDHPRRVGPVRLANRLLRRRDELRVHPPVLPRQRSTRHRLQRILLEVGEALLLRGLAEVHPELEDQRAVGGERLLELDDAVQALVEFGLRQPAVDAVEHGPRVPAAQKQADAPARRERPPEAPVLGPLELLVGRLAERLRDDPPRVHPRVQQVDGLALAGAVHAREHDDDGERRRRAQLALHLEQLAEEHRLTRLELFLRYRAPEFCRFEHGQEYTTSTVCATRSVQATICATGAGIRLNRRRAPPILRVVSARGGRHGRASQAVARVDSRAGARARQSGARSRRRITRPVPSVRRAAPEQRNRGPGGGRRRHAARGCRGVRVGVRPCRSRGSRSPRAPASTAWHSCPPASTPSRSPWTASRPRNDPTSVSAKEPARR